MANSIKRISIITLIAIFIVVMCLTFILTSKNLYGDTESGESVYYAEGTPTSGSDTTLTIWFNVGSVSRHTNLAILTLAVNGVDYPTGEDDEVYFVESDGTEHYLGILETPSNGTEVMDFELNTSWVKEGKNVVKVVVEYSWWAEVLGGKLYFTSSKWVRSNDMVCKTVWINEDNNFEFIFDYYYFKNNWVKIYDMDGNMVWETNFVYGKNRFVAELPDGMYTVKTFHNDMETPIQEFMIGKP